MSGSIGVVLPEPEYPAKPKTFMSKSRIPEPADAAATAGAPPRATPASGADPPAAIDARRQRLAALGDVSLELLDVDRHALEALRQRLDSLVSSRTRRFDADRLAARVG